MTGTMTQQDTFNLIVNHLFSQKVASVMGYSCRYRGPNGTMCAVGVLIPDTVYDEDFEMKPVSWIIDEIMQERGINALPWLRYTDLLSTMQTIHDEYMPRPENEKDVMVPVRNLNAVAERCQETAEKFGLTMPEIVNPYLTVR